MVDIKKMQERLYNQSYKVFFLWTKRPLKEEVEKVYWCTIEEINRIIQANEFYDKQIEAFKIFERYIKEEF